MSMNLVHHLWRCNREEIVANSLANCHVPGLHSLVLLNRPTHRIRMFVATKFHQLYANTGAGPLSLGFHPHHCDITLERVAGELENLTLSEDMAGVAVTARLSTFRFRSKILGHDPGFEPVSGPEWYWIEPTSLDHESPTLELRAADRHSVWVRKGGQAAWLVYEGAEDANFQPLCYSNQDLTRFDFKNLYEPMDERWVVNTLQDEFGGKW